MNEAAAILAEGSSSTTSRASTRARPSRKVLHQLVQRQHERDGARVVDRYDARDDTHGAERHQGTDDAQQLVGPGRRSDRGVAARAPRPVRSAPEPLQVVDGQRTVVELQGGQQRAVGPERPVRGDVHQPGPVHGSENALTGRVAVRQDDGTGVPLREPAYLGRAGGRPSTPIRTTRPLSVATDELRGELKRSTCTLSELSAPSA